jgi:hypothetical protein
LSPDLR